MTTMRLIVTLLLVSTSPVLHAFQVISQQGNEVRWPKRKVSYALYKSGSDNFSNGFDGAGNYVSAFAAVERSFDSWAKVPGLGISFTNEGNTSTYATGSDGRNSIVWVERGWQNMAFHPPKGALAVTISTFDFDAGEIVDSDIHFNGEYFDWAAVDSDREADKVDVQSIATHEIGHLLGLNHSSENPSEHNHTLREATMFYASNPGDVKQQRLYSDDIAGISHIYPAAQSNIPEPRIYNIYPGSASNDYATESVSVRINGSDFIAAASVKLTKKGCENCMDIQAHTVKAQNDNLVAEFDLRGQPAGRYDLMVHNSPTEEDGLSGSFEILDGNYGNYGYSAKPFRAQVPQEEYYEYGGCGFLGYAKRSDSGMFLLCCAVLLSFFAARKSMVSRHRQELTTSTSKGES